MRKFKLDYHEVTITKEDGTETRMSTPDFAQRLYLSASAPDLGLLPPAIRYLSAARDVMVYERPPQEQDVVVAGTTYHLPLPWTLFVLSFTDRKISSVRMFARNYPLSHPGDEVGLLPLPGLDDTGSLPLSEQPARSVIRNLGLNDQMNTTLPKWLKSFYARAFARVTPTDTDLVTLEAWAERSLVDELAMEFPGAGVLSDHLNQEAVEAVSAMDLLASIATSNEKESVDAV